MLLRVALLFNLVGLNECFHEYCIIGAGPAGLQMGYFLEQDNRDYIIYERAARAGKGIQ